MRFPAIVCALAAIGISSAAHADIVQYQYTGTANSETPGFDFDYYGVVSNQSFVATYTVNTVGGSYLNTIGSYPGQTYSSYGNMFPGQANPVSLDLKIGGVDHFFASTLPGSSGQVDNTYDNGVLVGQYLSYEDYFSYDGVSSIFYPDTGGTLSQPLGGGIILGPVDEPPGLNIHGSPPDIIDFTDASLKVTTVSAAPEPSVWALMLAGVAMIGLTLRQGRRQRGMALAA